LAWVSIGLTTTSIRGTRNGLRDSRRHGRLSQSGSVGSLLLLVQFCTVVGNFSFIALLQQRNLYRVVLGGGLWLAIAGKHRYQDNGYRNANEYILLRSLRDHPLRLLGAVDNLL
jgi:hypothetical protein